MGSAGTLRSRRVYWLCLTAKHVCVPDQAAVEEGIVPGGGVALLYASKVLAAHREAAANFDQKIGVDIVTHALRVPLKTIANNAGAVPLNAFLCVCTTCAS